MAWQAIETAPTSDEPILVYSPTEGCAVVERSGRNFYLVLAGRYVVDTHEMGSIFSVDDATHWMPLPANPSRLPTG